MAVSLQAFSDVLEKAAEHRIRKMCAEAAAANAPTQDDCGGDPAYAGVDKESLEELRRLAGHMGFSGELVGRFGCRAHEWAEEDAREHADEKRRRLPGAHRSVDPRRRQDLKEECSELQAERKRRREEKAWKQEESLGLCKSEFAHVLNGNEQRLLELQRSATGKGAAAGSGGGATPDEVFGRDVKKQVEQWRKTIACATQCREELAARKNNSDQIEALQKQVAGHSELEEFLERCGARGAAAEAAAGALPIDDGENDGDDEELTKLTEFNQEVLKRFRNGFWPAQRVAAPPRCSGSQSRAPPK